jgi:hypothetical protein
MSYIQKETLKTFWRAILNTNDYYVIKLAEDLMKDGCVVDYNDSLHAMMEVETQEEEQLHLEMLAQNEKFFIESDGDEDLPF